MSGQTAQQREIIGRLLEHWEAAAPLCHGVLAQDLGTAEERERTRALIHDLRVPVYAVDLLSTGQSEGAQRLLEVWQAECAGGADKRLAFIRALYQVKPRFLALPSPSRAPTPQAKPSRAARRAPSMTVLSRVEIMPGRFVRCRPGEEEAVKRRFALQARRRERR